MLTIEALRKCYGPLSVLDGCELHLETGEFVAIQGRSGCGKSTLLLIAGSLLAADGGRVCCDGRDVLAMSAAERNAYRAQTVGFVFQRFHLIPYLSVADNLRAAGMTAGRSDPGRAAELLERFGLAVRAGHLPGQLSVGEQQRCALARALYNRPRLLLADEPTGNLDADNARVVLDALARFAHEGGSVLMVTHNEDAARAAHRRLCLSEGRIGREAV